MAAANESQGLKIAVAVLVSTTVILAVTTYFGFSQYSQASAKQLDADKKASAASATAQTAVTQLGEMREIAGYKNLEDFEALKAAVKKDEGKLLSDLGNVDTETKKLLADYQGAGGSDPKIKELGQASQLVVAGLRDLPNHTLADSLSRLEELLKSQTLLAHAYAVDNLHLRDSLKSANTVNEAKLNEQIGYVTKSKEDLEGEHNEHEKARQDLLAKVDKLQTELSSVSTEYENFKTKSNLMKEDYDKKISDFKTQIAYYRDQLERDADIMDKPDGQITSIDYTRDEVRTNVTKAMGAKPNMTFAIFDARLPIPNSHPKGHIQLIQVDDRGSIGRIIESVRTGQSLQGPTDIPDPMHIGDYIYSAAWSPTSPTHFALIGKIDMDRDGKDDREDLKRLIKASGGMIEYDLPPPGAGRESGKLSSVCRFYVVDEQRPLADVVGRSGSRGVMSVEETDFMKRQTEAIREAKSLGIPPLRLERLLVWLGYTPFQTNFGRLENFDKKTSDSILYPRGKPVVVPSETPPAAPKPDESAAPKENGAAPK
ncbi:MAG TPA: hypothetical protein VGY53_02865 [Isosphaeraceae bacterium]|nr:hypothetical protein [Isosphaeraceae bacterium]